MRLSHRLLSSVIALLYYFSANILVESITFEISYLQVRNSSGPEGKKRVGLRISRGNWYYDAEVWPGTVIERHDSFVSTLK